MFLTQHMQKVIISSRINIKMSILHSFFVQSLKSTVHFNLDAACSSEKYLYLNFTEFTDEYINRHLNL